MTDLATSENFRWRSIRLFFTRKLTILQILANLAGAGIVTSYFMFFDPNLKIQRITMDLVVIGVMFVGLVLIATFFLRHWQKDLMQLVENKIQNRASDVSRSVRSHAPSCSRRERRFETCARCRGPGRDAWAPTSETGHRTECHRSSLNTGGLCS